MFAAGKAVCDYHCQLFTCSLRQTFLSRMSYPNLEPRWRRRPDSAARDLPYREWLFAQGSLTARIVSRCKQFSMKVVRQELARAERNEMALLGIRPHELAWVREVVLHADGKPVVFAHSVLPRDNMRGAWRLFAGIGNRPLGHALFADPRIQRTPLFCRRLDARDALWQGAVRHGAANNPDLWARRSLFLRSGKGLLITEVFLPEILNLK